LLLNVHQRLTIVITVVTVWQDREINGLNEQLEEDSRVLELLQKQLADERKKRAEIEKENSMLHEQVTMLMNMLDENEGFDEDGEAPPPDSFD
jgi:hypothetical protein